jgi:hypothetical protein
VAFQQDELWAVKTGAAALAVCLVRTLQKADPHFGDRFLDHLDRAYDHFQENHGRWTRRDGTPRDPQNVLEMLSWTRELLTGWNNISGQREPLLKE